MTIMTTTVTTMKFRRYLNPREVHSRIVEIPSVLRDSAERRWSDLIRANDDQVPGEEEEEAETETALLPTRDNDLC